MKETTNYKFKKPDPSDLVNINDINFNMDAVDKIINTNFKELDSNIKEISGREVGGRNYLTDTSERFRDIQVTRYATLIKDTTSLSEFGFKVGDTITFNCYIRAINKPLKANIETINSLGAGINHSGNVIAVGKEGYSKITIKIPLNTVSIRVQVFNNDTTITQVTTEQISGEKLEKGSYATDWTPGIEDTESKIDVLDRKIENFNHQQLIIDGDIQYAANNSGVLTKVGVSELKADTEYTLCMKVLKRSKGGSIVVVNSNLQVLSFSESHSDYIYSGTFKTSSNLINSTIEVGLVDMVKANIDNLIWICLYEGNISNVPQYYIPSNQDEPQNMNPVNFNNFRSHLTSAVSNAGNPEIEYAASSYEVLRCTVSSNTGLTTLAMPTAGGNWNIHMRNDNYVTFVMYIRTENLVDNIGIYSAVANNGIYLRLQRIKDTGSEFNWYYATTKITNQSAISKISIRVLDNAIGEMTISNVVVMKGKCDNYFKHGKSNGFQPIIGQITPVQTEPLWTGASFPEVASSITPSKMLIHCKTGWVIQWCQYSNGQVSSDRIQYTYIPKNSFNLSSALFHTDILFAPISKAFIKKYILTRGLDIRGDVANTVDGAKELILVAVLEY